MGPYAQIEIVVHLFGIFRSGDLETKTKALGGPGGFAELREASSKRHHLISYKLDLMVLSYDKKTEKLTTNKVTTISM